MKVVVFSIIDNIIVYFKHGYIKFIKLHYPTKKKNYFFQVGKCLVNKINQ